MSRLPTLTLDDPLARKQPQVEAESPPKTAPAAPKRRAASKRPAAGPAPAQVPAAALPAEPAPTPWREWGRGTHAATYRLPIELLDELTARVQALGLDRTEVVTAGLLTVLDLDDAALLAVIERVEDAKLDAGRQHRRSRAA